MPVLDESDEAVVPQFRKGVPLISGIAWNVPMAVLCLLLIRGSITPRQFEFLLVAWGGAIPIFAITLAYSRRVQRLLLTPSADVESLRPRLWALAGLWSAIVIFGLGSLLVM